MRWGGELPGHNPPFGPAVRLPSRNRAGNFLRWIKYPGQISPPPASPGAHSGLTFPGPPPPHAHRAAPGPSPGGSAEEAVDGLPAAPAAAAAKAASSSETLGPTASEPGSEPAPSPLRPLAPPLAMAAGPPSPYYSTSLGGPPGEEAAPPSGRPPPPAPGEVAGRGSADRDPAPCCGCLELVCYRCFPENLDFGNLVLE